MRFVLCSSLPVRMVCGNDQAAGDDEISILVNETLTAPPPERWELADREFMFIAPHAPRGADGDAERAQVAPCQRPSGLECFGVGDVHRRAVASKRAALDQCDPRRSVPTRPLLRSPSSSYRALLS